VIAGRADGWLGMAPPPRAAVTRCDARTPTGSAAGPWVAGSMGRWPLPAAFACYQVSSAVLLLPSGPWNCIVSPMCRHGLLLADELPWWAP
jgi:hypothetical protein